MGVISKDDPSVVVAGCACAKFCPEEDARFFDDAGTGKDSWDAGEQMSGTPGSGAEIATIFAVPQFMRWFES
ncbi:hypothetical protein [uncultured Desulfovibrio sp.]|uniref:hypothetical protein n=1 Tax=uncultured Desulfovibrio sp. TaxID=167968 RepID=UPI002620F4B0|nr:hypothetical protein [uncultured Desulfovibrio sp.]